MRYLKAVLFLLLIWVLCHAAYLVYDGKRGLTRNAEYAVILGSQVHEDGSLSQRLKARLDEGLRLYGENIVNAIVVSGGLGKEGYHEGDVMWDYLVGQGVPPDRIITDNEGINTRASAVNTMELTGDESIIVVSQYFHITRCKKLFKKAGFRDVQGASPAFWEIRDPYSVAREIVAYYVQ